MRWEEWQKDTKGAKKDVKREQGGAKKGASNVVVTYRTSSGLKREILVLRAHRTFHGGFVSQQTQTMPDDDDDDYDDDEDDNDVDDEGDDVDDDDEVQERTLFIKMASPLIKH